MRQLFGTTAEMWIDMQSRYDLTIARGRMEDRLNQTPSPS